MTRLRVWLAAVALPDNNPGQVVHTYVPLFTKQYNFVTVKGQFQHTNKAKKFPCTNITSIYMVGQKMAPFIVCLITSSNINRFSKFFHCKNQETICNETVTTDPTTPQLCRFTTSWNVRWRTQAGDATDPLRDQRWSSLACGPQTTPT